MVEAHEPSFLEALLVMGGIPVAIFLLSALVRGLYRHCVDLFGLHGVVQRWYHSGRPYNKAENVVSALIADIISHPESWEIIKDSKQYHSKYHAQKGNIVIRNCNYHAWEVDQFCNYTGPKIEIGDIEDYTMKDVRGDLLKDLYLTIDNLRAERANHAVLDTITHHKEIST